MEKNTAHSVWKLSLGVGAMEHQTKTEKKASAHSMRAKKSLKFFTQTERAEPFFFPF